MGWGAWGRGGGGGVQFRDHGGYSIVWLIGHPWRLNEQWSLVWRQFSRAQIVADGHFENAVFSDLAYCIWWGKFILCNFTTEINICAEYRGMLPRPRLVCQDKSSRDLENIHFPIFNSSMGWVGLGIWCFRVACINSLLWDNVDDIHINGKCSNPRTKSMESFFIHVSDLLYFSLESRILSTLIVLRLFWWITRSRIWQLSLSCQTSVWNFFWGN